MAGIDPGREPRRSFRRGLWLLALVLAGLLSGAGLAAWLAGGSSPLPL